MKRLFSMMMVAVGLAASSMTAQAELSPDGVIAVEHFGKLEQCMENMTAVLTKVTDKESADAQVEAFLAATKALTEQMLAMESLQNVLKGKPNADDEAAFEQCRNNLHVAGMAMQAELRRLAMVNFYDSEAFIKALMSLQAAQ
ncbi:MAG: hypothetical protein IKL98_01725 [Akkermansia sp.]|nr:hypothetical protein [Akkermansia sp.]